MTISKRTTEYSQRQRHRLRPSLWFEKIMALLATANYILVLFDFSYIPLRDFWLQGRVRLVDFKIGQFEYQFPAEPVTVMPLPVTEWYDWVKGIEPYRDTDEYLNTIEELKDTLFQSSLQSEEVEVILADLRQRSDEIIDTNPFQVANKTGTLERIKNLMREHIFGNTDGSSKEAFNRFWSQEYLSSNDPGEELDFFDAEIAPLIATNYFRPVGENGAPFDNFGLLDFPFMALFFVEFLARSWFISRRRVGVGWFDAMLWRWYDIILFFPLPHWLRFMRLFRIIPITIRLNQANLIDLHAIKKQASQGFVASIAEDLTEVVVVGLLNQVQGSVQRGELTDFLSSTGAKPYIDINNTNEISEIARLLVQLVVNQALPATRHEIEALLGYSFEKAISGLPAYDSLRRLPNFERMQTDLVQQTVSRLYDIVYQQILQLIEHDPEFDKLLNRLVETLSEALTSEIQGKQSLERMEYLLNALIEEIKINYVQRLSEEDIEALLDQTRALRQVARSQ
ncbi:MAG: hypothetical protein HC910_07280 [Spirulinaceae cyanobacterium SM2_1_0]|nr:hypothetical protein [Spirulinaceae cyanobacterium SM2_1_0]